MATKRKTTQTSRTRTTRARTNARSTRRTTSRARATTRSRRTTTARRTTARTARRNTRSQTKKKHHQQLPRTAPSAQQVDRKALGIIGLLVNVLLFPGLGTIIGGKTRTGVWQIILLAVGVILSVALIGLPLVLAAWIWALVSSIQILQGR